MRERIDTKREFALLRRAQSLSHATRGLVLFVKTTPNAWIQMVICLCVIAGGVFFGITPTEWLFIIIASGTVFVSEAFNTAIEIDIDLTSPEYHPYARDTKDVAAGAVLLSSCMAVLVGCVIFIPYLLEMIR